MGATTLPTPTYIPTYLEVSDHGDPGIEDQEGHDIDRENARPVAFKEGIDSIGGGDDAGG